MTTVGYDAIHDNVHFLPQDAAVVMGYDTGSAAIKWTDADWARFTTTRKVHIDQGAGGSPFVTATVRDVETGAWTPEAAVSQPWDSRVARPTIYCNRDTLPRVMAAGWQGELWLAIPGWKPGQTLPDHGNSRVVAVQNVFAGDYDSSIVLDPTWPEKDTPVSGFQFPNPQNLQQVTSVDLVWDAVPPVDGHEPTGYTVVLLGLDNHEYFRAVTPETHITANGLHTGWTFNVLVWANGGSEAPPHSVIQVQT